MKFQHQKMKNSLKKGRKKALQNIESEIQLRKIISHKSYFKNENQEINKFDNYLEEIKRNKEFLFNKSDLLFER